MYRLRESTRNEKKFMIITPKGKKIHFGASGYEDYTVHKDKMRKQRYIMRHTNNEDWANLNTAGFWSRWLLWNKLTLSNSINDVEKKFGIQIYY